MQNQHLYRVMAWWSAAKTGLAKSESAPNVIHFAAPPQFGGLEGRWSPEDLLLSALAACFTTTFRALAEHSNFSYTDLAVQVDGTVRKVESGYMFERITIRPRLTLSHQEEHLQADGLLNRAKQLCLISRALAIPQAFEPTVEIKRPRVEANQAVLPGEDGLANHGE